MASHTVTCTACGKSFQAEEGLPHSFCVYCGARQQAQPAPLPDEGAARKAALQKLAASPDADEHVRGALALWGARFVPVGRNGKRMADEFIRLWSTFAVYGRGGRTAQGQRQAQKMVEAFFGRSALRDALQTLENPQQALYRELLDAARLYVRVCLSDRHYGSTMFDLVRLKPEEVAKKLADEMVQMMLLPLLAMPDSPHTRQLMAAAVQAYRLECGAHQPVLERRLSALPGAQRARLQAALEQWHA